MQIPAEGAPGDYGSGPCILRAGKRHIEVPNEHEGSLPNKSSRITQNESNETVRREYENLAKQFLHLAKEADRYADGQTGYESLPVPVVN